MKSGYENGTLILGAITCLHSRPMTTLKMVEICLKKLKEGK
jgi:hypothetical protein